MIARRPRVLLVHNDKRAGAMLAARLARRGFDMMEIERADDAVAAARVGAPDVTLVDASPLELRETDVCAEIKNTPGLDMPVVILAERAAEADIEAAFERGADECLTAPFSVDELSRVLMSAVREWTARSRAVRVNNAAKPTRDFVPARRPTAPLVRWMLLLGCFIAVRRLVRGAR
jgi:DNA-binding response OmpR family regulator